MALDIALLRKANNVHLPRTVRFRTTLVATSVVALALAISAVALIFVLRTTLTNGLEHNAREHAEALGYEITQGNEPNKDTALYNEDGIVQILDAADDSVVSSSTDADGAYPISDMRPEPDAYETERLTNLGIGDHTDFLIVAHGVNGTDARYVILVGTDLEPVTDATFAIARLLAVIVPILILVVGISTWIVAGRALRPVQQIRQQVETIGATDLNLRVSEPDSKDEVGLLARTMNSMLSRLEHASEVQRRFVSDASHELRSPLTSIRTRLEVELTYPDETEWRSTAGELLEESNRLSRLVEDLLTLARHDNPIARPRPHVAIDLDEIVLKETAQLSFVSALTVDTTAISGAQVFGNPDDLTRVVRNLLDNATRHAKSRVRISLAESQREVTLIVSDDGPGIPETHHMTIFERFTRLDEARTRDAGGSGLGLAIVKEILDAHGASIAVSNDPGATFTIIFPSAFAAEVDAASL